MAAIPDSQGEREGGGTTPDGVSGSTSHSSFVKKTPYEKVSEISLIFMIKYIQFSM